uniref:Related to CSN12-COP9 signalosome (CSN) subunit n=1 Tax=Melanopsichium pennsylvanicum 4 TaxID=1398559 RepID=A0A077R5Q1_9BASI|nr:related to CSN12-COP9 signalosome (CSN) subunit [Melanopsichium pennsylvanicum 4]
MKPAVFADAVITASKTSDGHSLASLFAIGGPVAASVFGVTAFLRFFATLTPGRWAIPLLRILCLNLRWLAVIADQAAIEVTPPAAQNHLLPTTSSSNNSTSQAVAAAVAPTTLRTSSIANKKLEECARQLNKAFTACIADRNPDLEQSRKWGIYEIVGLVFKTYFRLKSISLCRNILRAISAAQLPDLGVFPKSQQDSKMFRQNLSIYTPFIRALKNGDVKSFDQALSSTQIESTLVKRGTYVAIERARDAVLRTLLKHIYLSLPNQQDGTRQTRLSLDLLHKATSSTLVGGLDYSKQELEWVLATLVYKGYVKGYIAHERGVLVLSAKDPFPHLGSVTIATI